jgi:putative oxidoreductase
VRILGLSSIASRFASFAPLAARVIVGAIMVAHGWQKLSMGPANVGQGMLARLGVPLPIFMGYVLTFTEFFGGILLIIGLLSRLVAIALTIDLVVAMLLAAGLGELELSLVAGFLVVLLAGPGKASVDYALGLEGDVVERPSDREARARGIA